MVNDRTEDAIKNKPDMKRIGPTFGCDINPRKINRMQPSKMLKETARINSFHEFVITNVAKLLINTAKTIAKIIFTFCSKDSI